jgi:hypothetical protein
MPTIRPTGAARLSAILLPAVLAGTIAACSSVTGAPPSSSPGDSPTPPPIATPSPVPTADPTADPTATPVPSVPADGGIKLDIADEHDVTVFVDNVTGYPVRVTSGRAGDGMSVQWGKAEIVNVDDSTLRVTWSSLPVDAQINLNISFDDATGGMILLTFKQPAPPANSDAIGFDRVIILSFDTPVLAEEVFTKFVEAA